MELDSARLARGIRSTRVVIDGAVRPAAIRFATDGNWKDRTRSNQAAGADLLDVGSLVVSPGLVDSSRARQRARAHRLGGLHHRDPRRGCRAA